MKKRCLNVTLQVKPERREEFLAAIRANQQGTLTTESLAKVYTLGESTTEKNTFYLHEQYIGAQGLVEHNESAHFAKWKEFAGAEDSPFASTPVVDVYDEFDVDFDNTVVAAQSPTATKTTPYYCVNVNFYVKAENRDAFIAAMSAVQQPTVSTESGVRVYSWGENIAQPNTFHVQEQYADLQAFDAHAKSSHFSSFAQFAFNEEDSPFAKPPALLFFEEI